MKETKKSFKIKEYILSKYQERDEKIKSFTPPCISGSSPPWQHPISWLNTDNKKMLIRIKTLEDLVEHIIENIDHLD